MRANGGESIAHALYTYRPEDVRTLGLLLKYENIQSAEKAYAMYALRYLLMRNGVEYPAYTDYCESLREKPRVDNRTGTDIYNDIMNQLKT